MVEGVIMATATSVQQPRAHQQQQQQQQQQGAKAVGPACSSSSSSAINKVLLSDPVRRLFNQPNIVIHAIPRNNSPTAFRMVRPKSFSNNKNDINGEYHLPNKPGVSIQVINAPSSERNEEENLLPSKNYGKSEILLVPIVRKRKECGHFEPCESLVCNVDVQQFEDDEGITPLVSINISEDEIDASVTKHCENGKCDALSIDHDRCSRALIQLYHCDKCIKCDICGSTFKSRKARINHKKCRRKEIYQHNYASPSDILKIRMRERELQILEAARLKRSCDYLDPVTGFNRTMEALKKNEELIIIPKMPPLQSKASMLSFTPVNNNNSNTSNNNNINNNNSIRSILGNKRMPAEDTDKELTSEMISNIILSCQNSIESKKRNIKVSTPPSKQIKLSDHLNGATVNIRDTPNVPNQQCIDVNKLSSNNSNIIAISKQQPPPLAGSKGLALNNVNTNLPQQQQVTNTGVDPSKNSNTDSLKQLSVNTWVMSSQPYSTPLRVVPIAELKSEPSLLHQTQGVPKFCMVPDTSVPLPQLVPKLKRPYQNTKQQQATKKPVPPPRLVKLSPKTAQVLNSGKFRPLQPALSGNARNVDVKLAGALLSKKQKGRKRSRKKLPKKGKFKCTHCPKRFSSVDYCKLHIAKHTNDPSFFCKLCNRGFLNKYLMKKHMDADHEPEETRCEMCDCVLPTLQEYAKHVKCPEPKIKQECSECLETFENCGSLDVHMRKEHGFLICTLCKKQVTKSKMRRHLMLEHSISKNRSEASLEKLSYPPGENDKLCEVHVISEVRVPVALAVVKVEPVKENKVVVVADCLARSRSIRRRSSKEFFICTVCERRFENEKQYQIHLANNPMKFTLCPDCGRKFHRKSEYTEHSKSCTWNTVIPVNETPKRRKSNLSNEGLILKSDKDIISRNSIDQKQNKTLKSINCKKLKLNEEKIVQKEDEDNSVLKSTVETKIMNGLKPDSSDCLEKLKIIKVENNIQKNEDYEIIERGDKEVLLLSTITSQTNSDESAVFDKLAAVTNINQDHNYQALQ